MTSETGKKLEELRCDYSQVVGEPFQHFFCPITFKDEPSNLCKAHLINQAFSRASTKWTLQRADVDNFFGSHFESDFTALRLMRSPVESFFRDPFSVKHLRPQTYINGKKVDHYAPSGAVPPEHLEVEISGPKQSTVRLGLKIRQSDLPESKPTIFEVGIEKDCRMSALVSVIKSAHLILFEMLGYRYALSAGGIFTGREVLGSFFLKNRGLTKKQVLSNSDSHFLQYSNLVRPVLNPEKIVYDAATDRSIYICEGLSQWAFLLYIRTEGFVHAAIIPLLETPDAAAHFVKFLNAKGYLIHARQCQFIEGVFQVSPNIERLTWPESNFEVG